MSAKVKNWLTGGIECPLEDVTLRLLSKQQCVCGLVTVDYFLDLPLRTHTVANFQSLLTCSSALAFMIFPIVILNENEGSLVPVGCFILLPCVYNLFGPMEF